MSLFRLGVGVSLVVRAARDPGSWRASGSCCSPARGRAGARPCAARGASGTRSCEPGSRRWASPASRTGSTSSRPGFPALYEPDPDAAGQPQQRRPGRRRRLGRRARGLRAGRGRGRGGAGMEEHVLPLDGRPRSRCPRHRRGAAARAAAHVPGVRDGVALRPCSRLRGSASAPSRSCATTRPPGPSSASSRSAAGRRSTCSRSPRPPTSRRAVSP